jgi:hypothetical protein
MMKSGQQRKHDPEAAKRRLEKLAREKGEKLEASQKRLQKSETIYSTEKR